MIASVWDRFVEWFRRQPHKLWLVLVPVMFFSRDHIFPFSSLPMYGDFPDRTYYVYLADAAGRELPLYDTFGYRSTYVKRIFNRKRNEIVAKLNRGASDEEEVELHELTAEQVRPAGDAVLKWLVQNNRRRKAQNGPLPPLQLVQVDILEHEGRLSRQKTVVGLFPGEKSAPPTP